MPEIEKQLAIQLFKNLTQQLGFFIAFTFYSMVLYDHKTENNNFYKIGYLVP
jgi:hypothetical protein